MRVNKRILAITLALVFVCSACATHQLRTTALISEQASAAAVKLQKNVQLLRDAGMISQESYDKSWKPSFIKIGEAGLLLDDAIRKSDSKGVIEQVDVMIGLLDGLVREGIPNLNQSDQAAVLIYIETARAVLVTVAAAFGGV